MERLRKPPQKLGLRHGLDQIEWIEPAERPKPSGQAASGATLLRIAGGRQV